jgi:hypothetical protein
MDELLARKRVRNPNAVSKGHAYVCAAIRNGISERLTLRGYTPTLERDTTEESIEGGTGCVVAFGGR